MTCLARIGTDVIGRVNVAFLSRRHGADLDLQRRIVPPDGQVASFIELPRGLRRVREGRWRLGFACQNNRPNHSDADAGAANSPKPSFPQTKPARHPTSPLPGKAGVFASPGETSPASNQE